ncbi:hypothetical protein GCK72_003527 [Caenorhabditis remanei]|uniref:PAN-3 domain-containing protein n=1 Tax=Caenorhabditis remanei TaxID=31234 RepID=A0A6A5HU07_CAERE|nr:hypothetical protein GCK72_003527 [Caenorhabditis remanei]KAF1771700.1 hypothetical protein GCK72_003527 [Caenorhabditis remanei]
MNILYFILSFTFLLITIAAGAEWKMMLIYGEPVDSSDSQIAYYSSAGCQHFKFMDSEIRKLNSSENKLVGIKRFLGTEECPKRVLNPLVDTAGSVSDTWTISNTLYNVTIVSNGSTVTISRRVYECDTGSKLFQRGPVYVCIGLRFFNSSKCGTHPEAVSLCQKDGWLTITGPRGTDELDYFLAQRKNASLGSGNLIWVDGINDITVDDTTGGYVNYPQCDGFSQTDCKYMGHVACANVSTFRCSWRNDGVNCWRGAACRRELTKLQ